MFAFQGRKIRRKLERNALRASCADFNVQLRRASDMPDRRDLMFCYLTKLYKASDGLSRLLRYATVDAGYLAIFLIVQIEY